MGSVVLNGATSGATTITPTDAVTVTCTLPSTGGTLQTSGAGFTTNGVAYATSTSALATGSGLQFNGTNLGVGLSAGIYSKIGVNGNIMAIDGGQIGWLTSQGAPTDYIDGSQASHYIRFFTNNAEQMRLDSSGNLLVGDTGSVVTTGKLRTLQTLSDYTTRFQNNNASSPQGLSIYYSGAAPNGTANPFLYCEDNSTLRMSVRSNGGIANYSANNVNLSDETMKKDIQLAGNYLDKLTQIPVKTFLFNDQTDTDLNLGVIAQDVKAVAPELVGTMNIGTDEKPNVKLAIYETDLKYAMLKAIQELNTLVTTQSAEIAALKAKVGA